MFGLTPLEVLLVWIAVTIGSTVQAAVGFGMALIAAPPLLLIHAPLVPGPLMAASLVLTGLTAYRDRASVDVAGVGWALAGRCLGTVAAAGFLVVATQRTFDLGFGVLVIAGVALSLLGARMVPSPRNSVVAGALSGLMGTVSSIGGPPMALLYQDAGAARLRGTLSIYFVIGTAMSIVALVLIGKMETREWVLSGLLATPMLLGFLCAEPLRARLQHAPVRPAVLGLSFASGLAVLARALSG